jgi:hypothetical protein
MRYSYEDLCEWRREAQVEMKKYKTKVDKSKSFSGKVDNVKKGLGFFERLCESGALQQILEKFGK